MRGVDVTLFATADSVTTDRPFSVYEAYNARGHYVAISNADRHERLDYAVHRFGTPLESSAVRTLA